MLPRFGHSLVTDRRGALWLFGGYSLSHGPLNDIRLFDTKNNTWMQVWNVTTIYYKHILKYQEIELSENYTWLKLFMK